MDEFLRDLARCAGDYNWRVWGRSIRGDSKDGRRLVYCPLQVVASYRGVPPLYARPDFAARMGLYPYQTVSIVMSADNHANSVGYDPWLRQRILNAVLIK